MDHLCRALARTGVCSGLSWGSGLSGDGTRMKGLESVQHVGRRGSGDERHRKGDAGLAQGRRDSR